jgi:hypothetical protein
MIDPNVAPIRSLPRDARDLMIAATNGHVVAFDNVSNLPRWLSDDLARLATGSGFGTRELYSDGEEVLFHESRPILLNGIPDIAHQQDLLNRAVVMTLKPIGDERRRDEKEFYAAFVKQQPRIFGGLLDCVVDVLANEGRLVLPRKPRMADFATVLVAAAPSLSWSADDALASYERNQQDAVTATLEGDPIADAVRALAQLSLRWQGTSTELLAEVNSRTPVDRREGKWFRRGKELSEALRRLAPSLRRVGVMVEFDGVERGRSHRLITIRKGGGTQVTAVAAVTEQETCKSPVTASVTASNGSAETPLGQENGLNSAVTPDTAAQPTLIATEGDWLVLRDE